MAVPAIAGRRAQRISVSPEAVAPSEGIRMRRFGRGYFWIVIALAAAALLSRVYTTNSLAGEPTSDEYLYAVHARDLARDWASGKTVSLEDLSVQRALHPGHVHARSPTRADPVGLGSGGRLADGGA